MHDFNVGLKKLRELTGKLTENGYLIDRAEQWEFALDAVPDLVFIINQDYKIKYINKELAKRLNINKNDVINKTCCDVFSNTKNVCLCSMNLSTSGLLNYDFENNKPLNKTINLGDVHIESVLNGWFNFTRSSIFNDDGDLLGFICVLRDITDRMAALEELRQSEEQYRHLVDNAPSGIYEIDFINNKFIHVNEIMCIKTGYLEEELLNKMTPFDLLTSYGQKYFQKKLNAIFEDNETPEEVEFEIIRKNGTTFWVILHIQYKHDLKGNVVGATVISHDIDERKKMEEVIRKSEEKYRNIHETAPLAFISWDFGCNITEWNKNAEKVFGWRKKEVLGNNLFDYIIPNQTKNKFECVVRDLSDDYVENVVNENVTKDGRIIICEWYNSVFHDCTGKPVGVISLVSDISEEKEKEKLIRSIFKASPSGIGLVKGRIIQWSNRKLREMTGYNEEELNNKDMRIFYNSDEEYERVGKIKYSQLSKEAYGYVRTVWQKKDGTLMNVLLSAAQVDSDNTSKDVVFTVTDVTNWNKYYRHV